MKKGFTLIELLAVIVVLAIIALIAIPIILGVVENARKSAAGSSALGYIDAVEKEIALGGFNENIYPTGKVDITSTSPYNNIEVNGSMPSKGTLNITDNYIVETSVLCINNYKVELTGHKVSKITKDGCDDMETPLPPKPPVEDKKPKFSGVEDVEVPQWTEFDPKEGVTATDSEGNDITAKIEVDRGDFTTAIAGAYTLTYSVSDEAGNEAIAERKITVTPSEYIDNSHAATPNLKDGLVPVTIDDDGTVHKADITSRWYDYDEKKWANAVILNDNASVGEDGIITEDSINAYFVWIPKYRYQLWNLGNYATADENATTGHAKQIEIEFNLEDTVDSVTTCKTPMLSGETGQCAVDKWMTHPAFISFGVDGFWVGKFEVTGTANALSVKPNSLPYMNQPIKTFFDQTLNYDKSENRILDSHMMKNTEWGAVAYLSHSKYGINRQVNYNNFYSYSGDKYKTGCGDLITKASSSNCNDYTTDLGKGASTTGNITGVYDMGGGAVEYVAAHNKDYYGYSSSGFNATNILEYDAKYFDIYQQLNKLDNYTNRILGDATGEMGPFKDGLNSWYGER